MILAINIGNTRISVGFFNASDEEPPVFEELHTDLQKTSMEYAIDLNTMLTFYAISRDAVNEAVIASVVSPLTSVLRSAVKELFSVDVLVIDPTLHYDFTIDTDQPDVIGSDLLCSVEGALKTLNPPFMVLQMRTATALSVVEGTREAPLLTAVFIAPGAETAHHSLVRNTASLPDITPGASAEVIGRNTIDSMKSGYLYGNAGLIDGLVTVVEQKTQKAFSLIATGCHAEKILPYTVHHFEFDQTLVLKGMIEIAAKNRGL